MDEALAFAAVVFTATGLLIGLLIGGYNGGMSGRELMENQAIEQGYGHINNQRVFQWNNETKGDK